MTENLGHDIEVARRALLTLLEAAATAQPSGKQNTFAAHNLPDLILVEIREKNLPVSYANAFLDPARKSRDRTLVQDALAKLADYMERVGKTYDLACIDRRAFVALGDYTLPGAEALPSLCQLQVWLAHQLPEA